MAGKRIFLLAQLHAVLNPVLKPLCWFLLALCCVILSPSLTLPIVATPANAQVQQGLQLYQADQFAEAVQVFQQAVDAAPVGSLERAQALNYLSLTHQKLGNAAPATATIYQSLQILRPLASQRPAETTPVLAQALNTQGQLKLARGDAEAALKVWQEATTLYQRSDQSTGVIGSTLNQAQALQAMGLHRQAADALASLQGRLQAQPDSLLKVTALRSHGDSQRVIGEVQTSRKTLEAALAIARNLKDDPAIADTLLSLGNTIQAIAEEQLRGADADLGAIQETLETALNHYQEAARIAKKPIVRAQSQLNQANLIFNHAYQFAIFEWEDAKALITQLQAGLTQLPSQRSTIYLQLNLVQSLIRLRRNPAAEESLELITVAQQPGFPSWQDVANIAAIAVQQAQNLGDKRAESYALGILGTVYERTGQLTESKRLTRQALLLSQSIRAADVSYRWLWQTGRLFRAEGDRPQAIAAYRESTQILRALRTDLVAINPDVQFSFRESVEPIYREFVSLLLENSSGNPQSQPNQADLQTTREAIESLQLAELENFLRQACLEGESVDIDSVDSSAAVIYPIILKNQLAIILSLPNQPDRPLYAYQQPIGQTQLDQTVNDLRDNLRDMKPFQPLARQVYNWLIAPLQPTLAEHQIKTLIFVLDGSLRNIPMAALYDGQRYLVETYNIALTPGLRLLDVKPLKRDRLSILVGALSEKSTAAKYQSFAELPNVATEVQTIQTEVKSHQVLLNQDFTKTNFSQAIQAFKGQIVHLATHGNFSSNRDNTFLLTKDDILRIDELALLLRGRRQLPIELLVLSACQTAEGDGRAALGLAGMAVQAGARSTIGSLWNVSDEATATLMRQFYQELTNTNLSKAEALRRAQLRLIQQDDRSHPFYWAPFILVGNWL